MGLIHRALAVALLALLLGSGCATYRLDEGLGRELERVRDPSLPRSQALPRGLAVTFLGLVAYPYAFAIDGATLPVQLPMTIALGKWWLQGYATW